MQFTPNTFTLTLTQKELQNILRESCVLNQIDDAAIIEIHIGSPNITVQHPKYKGEPMEAPEPVNNKDGH